MATVTLSIPDQHLGRVVAALCSHAGSEPTPANAKAAVVAEIKAIVRGYERQQAQQAAILAAEATAEPVDEVVS